MAPLKRLNHILEEAECLALREIIAQEEAVLDNLRKVQNEHEAKRQLVAEKAIILQRTLDSTEILRDVGSKLCTHFMPLLVQLEAQLAVQEDDSTIVATHLPSTFAFIQSWGVLKDGITTLDAAMKRGLDRTQERITSIAQQLYSTESLRDQISSSISSFASMIECAQDNIKAKKRGILHPIRRLPVEILLHIFEDCVSDEINECHRNPPSIFEVPPTMALRLASVCSRWRDIMLETPHLWRHLRAPTRRSGPGVKGHFQNYFDRCRGGEIELTIPTKAKLPDDLNPDTMTVQRLNLAGNITKWPILPSPVHLWLYHPNPVSGWMIPSELISRTTHLTVRNVGISFLDDCKSLTRLEICGLQQPDFVFTQIIRQLPNLTDLDLIRAEMEMEDTPIPVLNSFTHFHLKYLGLSHGWIDHGWIDLLGLSHGWIDLLERGLDSGLRLPQLRHLELSGITFEYMATKYPLVSAQLGATVVRLDFRGEYCSLDAIRSFVDAFTRVNTIGCYGGATETVLGALYEVRTSRVQIPGEDAIGCTREIVHAMPKGLEVVIIRDYEGEGREIDQQLRMMRQSPAADTLPINVVFENCLDILPRIRQEFAVPGPLIVIESVDPQISPGQSMYDPGDILEAADELDM